MRSNGRNAGPAVVKSVLVILATSAALLLGADPRTAGAADAKADPLDWPNWRGPEQNGVSRETGLIDKWDRLKDAKYDATDVVDAAKLDGRKLLLTCVGAVKRSRRWIVSR